MGKHEWIKRCADYYEAAGMKPRSLAIEHARITYDVQVDANGDDIDDPATAAREEMSYWEC